MCNDLIKLRHDLHRFPECSDKEIDTAHRIATEINQCQPDQILTQLGGHGLAAVFDGVQSGPTIMLRAELDALPIQELNSFEHRSEFPNVGHKCGHDGHMTMLVGVAQWIKNQRLPRGRVVLLFQPAEETGQGAQRVLSDSRFQSIMPDLAIALHNLPGHPLGSIIGRSETMACSSQGLSIELQGRTAHAAQPETGISPAHSLCDLLSFLQSMNFDNAPPPGYSFVTTVHAQLGREVAFGTAPDFASVCATIRSDTDQRRRDMVESIMNKALELATRDELTISSQSEDEFPATVNSSDAIQFVRKVTQFESNRLSYRQLERPLRWSEDFGHFLNVTNGALLGIGAGNVPDLHDPMYDFPDELIPYGVEFLSEIIRLYLGES